MSKLHYHRAMSAIVTHSLLHLYSQISNQKQFMPRQKRNELLVKFFKQRVDLKGYSIAKKDIKALIHTGRHAKADLESQLWKLNSLNLEAVKQFSEADELYILLNDLYHHCGYASQLVGNDVQNGVIYMSQEEIEQGFDSNNRQLRTLRMRIKTDDCPQKLIDCAAKISAVLSVSFEHEKDGVLHYNIDRVGAAYANQ